MLYNVILDILTMLNIITIFELNLFKLNCCVGTTRPTAQPHQSSPPSAHLKLNSWVCSRQISCHF